MKYIHWSVVRLKFGIFHFNSAFLNWPLSFGVRSVTHEVDALLFLNEILLKQKIKTSANGVNTHTMCRLIFFFFFCPQLCVLSFKKTKKKKRITYALLVSNLLQMRMYIYSMLLWFLSFSFSLTLFFLSVFRTWAYNVSRRRMWMRPSLAGCRPIITPSTVSGLLDIECTTQSTFCVVALSLLNLSLCEMLLFSVEEGLNVLKFNWTRGFTWSTLDW